MKTYFEKKRSEIQKDLDKMMGSLVTDIAYRFAWDGEEIFKMATKIQLIDEILIGVNELENSGVQYDVKEKIASIIKNLTARVMSQNLMDRSTGQLHSLTSLWKKEVIIRLINDLQFDRFELEEK